ncbi:MAG: hypothetical protein ACM3SS_02700 [Rhodospirillaceae bacterium]
MNARTLESKVGDLSQVRPHIGCHYCTAQGVSRQAYILTGDQAEPRWAGWTRYSCAGGGHRFAVPEHTVVMRRDPWQ